MGKSKYNAKARQVVKTNIDDSKTSEIKLDFQSNEYGAADASNALALPSKKRHTKVISEKKEKTRFLSKAHRKRLEKIVEKKKKKENRAALLDSLAQVQATADEVSQLTAISAVQTIGLRKLHDYNFESKVQQEAKTGSEPRKFSSIAGAKKRLRLLKLEQSGQTKRTKYDPNVVGLEESSSEESSSESDANDNDDDDEPEVIENGVAENNTQLPKETKSIEVSNVETENPSNDKGTKVSRTDSPKKSEDKNVIEIKEEKKPLLAHPTQHVEVKRDPKIQIARLKLPILGEEQRVMELINENEFLIVAGETGSGKTTQIPQFLYEAGYASTKMIAVTEPRRVATVAMAARVGYELGLSSKEVSYLMRFEGNVGKETKIKFMTDGVLLKEIQSDFLLSKYSVVIIDEAHERSVYTDILLGLLSRIVPLRRKRGSPLRLIIMSATLRIEDFTENTRLFKTPPPVIKIESRQFPVTVHFNKHTYSDYLKEAYKKAVKIHTRLPEGGILIFVTGQQEVHYLVRKLRTSFPYKKNVDYSKLIQKKRPTLTETEQALDSEPEDIESDDDEVEKEMKRMRKARRKMRQKHKELPKINLDDYDMPEDDGQADLIDDNDDQDSEGHLSDSDAEDDTLIAAIKNCRQPLWVLPLYSMLGSSKQARVFQPAPAGARLCVVSTDVAETSLTIPAIKYVVDTGKKKMRVYDHVTGASAWRVVWTSQASAEQRSGRAGRTAPGHAYRLYSSAVFQHDCVEQYPPDICRRPPDHLTLTMKCMGIDKVVNFPFPTAPDRMQLRLAEQRLEVLGLLERHQSKAKRSDDEDVLKVTALGRAVSAFPLLPRYGKLLALSHQPALLPYTVALVAALSVPEVMSGKPDSWPATGHLLLLGDPGVLLRAVGAAEHAHLKGEEELFCAKYGLREKAVQEIRKLRKQLSSEIRLCVPNAVTSLGEASAVDDGQARLLRQLVLTALGDQVATKIQLHEVKEGEDKRKYKYAYHCANMEEPVHLHSESILRKVIPEWVVYQELYETGSEERRKMVMRHVTAIEPEWLPVYVPKLCNLGDPLSDPEPRYDAASGRVKCHFKGTFGKAGWELPTVEIDYPERLERYRWFAKFLLEGGVFPKLKKYASSLLSPPSTMVKSWATLQPRTDVLLKALVAKRAGCKDSLKSVWEDQPKYLLNEYLRWLPESAHNEASLYWPPI
ncbi:probable ATP-dependent RNA helicase kurz [Plutella xylostella]|uniref:probable ATP-dependent RNA helicase kurz n=1 Tax=Plutella xylostella TaxID=51655 RepID=UPI002032A35F|nr:probable ATP-dependent RNA helicase kurz [Plutella xylostella]